MKFKRIMLVTFLLLAILTIGAVSASDDGDELAAVDMGGDDSDIVESPACDDEILGNWTDSGMDDITTDGNSSGQSGESYNIVFHEDEVYNNKVDGETPVVDIIVPEGSNGTINVTVEGNEWTLSNFPLQLLDVSDTIWSRIPFHRWIMEHMTLQYLILRVKTLLQANLELLFSVMMLVVVTV